MNSNLRWTALPLGRRKASSRSDGFFERTLRYSLMMCFFAWFLGSVATSTTQAQTGWKLVWSDEFNGPAGSRPDPANWKFEEGPGRYVGGNQEAETYCSFGSGTTPCNQEAPNAFLDGEGHSVIKAIKTDQSLPIAGKNFSAPIYTSARVDSLKSFRYGRRSQPVDATLA